MKIGDYIHYHHVWYKKYGINRKQKGVVTTGISSYNGADKIMKTQKQNIVDNVFSTKAKAESIKDLEEYLNQIVYPKDNQPRFGSKEQEEAFISLVNDEFHKRFSDFDIDWNNGLTVHANKNLFKKGQERKSVGVLKQYADIIEAKAEEMIGDGKVSNAKVQELINTAKEIRKLTDGIANDNKYISFTGKEELKNRIASALNSGSLPFAGAIGEAFEDVLAYASVFGKSIAGQTVKDALVGVSGRSRVLIDTSFLEKEFINFDLLKSYFSNGYQIDENTNITFKSNAETQNKVDVIFGYNGETYNISAKNYALRNSNDAIHILSGASMLSLIQNEPPDFVNHWLNIVTPDAEDFKTDDLGSLLMTAHQAMRTVILAKAFTGSVYGRTGAADTFVLNKRSASHVYVFSMHEIVSQLVKTMGNITDNSAMNTIVKIENYPETLDNIWKGIKDIPNSMSADIRITGLILALQNAKLKVSIPQTSIERLQE